MADIQAVAKRLKNLTDLASHRARGRGFPSQVQQVPPRSGPRKSFEELEYERFVGRLDPDERETLDRLIEKMLSAP
ncbi:MAG TPA: hypothetical protein VME45_00765 [Stellaceae bacterium]|nr:hypothetical protein [Stellaceae bacterium]